MFTSNTLNNPYLTANNPVLSKNGMVASSHPLSAQAGLTMLKKGGNAIDAAIAAAACETVVEPTSNGIGSDACAIIWYKDKLYGLNGTGKSPNSISIDAVKKRGFKKVPKHGWIPVTVPGAPGMWAELSEKLGKLPFTEVLKPAIQYAQEGFPISPVLGKYWGQAFQDYKKELKGDEFENWFQTFSINGQSPKTGEIWSSQDHAETLISIAESKANSFYQGKLAEKIDEFSKKTGGFLTADDLAAYKPRWVDPISVDYRGYDVWELPPNTQGIVVLQALNILKGFEFQEKDQINTYHKQIESIKLALTDGLRYITDSDYMNYNIQSFFHEKYTRIRRNLINETALLPEYGAPLSNDTVYLAAADKEGNMVSFIQSNYMGFGSGLVVPDTGIALQNRGHSFSMSSDHPNALVGGKYPFHTIIPGFITQNNKALGPFGVMGGLMMPQGQVQVLSNMIDFHLNPQAALDAPRWKWVKDRMVEMEANTPDYIINELKEKGHVIYPRKEKEQFGRGQIILRNSVTGVLMGGTESRTDGTIASW